MRHLLPLALSIVALHAQAEPAAKPGTSSASAGCATSVYADYVGVTESWQRQLRDAIVDRRADLNEIAGLNQSAEALRQQRRLAQMKYLLVNDVGRLPADGSVVGLAAFAWKDSDEKKLRDLDYEYASLAQKSDDTDRLRSEHAKLSALREFIEREYADEGLPGLADFARGVQTLDAEWSRCSAAPRPTSRIE